MSACSSLDQSLVLVGDLARPARPILTLSRNHHRSACILPNHTRHAIPARESWIRLCLCSHRLASLCICTSPSRVPPLLHTYPRSPLGWSSVRPLSHPFSSSPHPMPATIPIAMFAERGSSRRTPLVIGLFALLGGQVLLMEAPNYALMAVARALQGISSSMVWTVGLALL